MHSLTSFLKECRAAEIFIHTYCPNSVLFGGEKGKGVSFTSILVSHTVGTLSYSFTFCSSFSPDTSVERNTLMERVYPQLKSYCQERGYDFQVVDMRWGVRDESTDDHMTTELCMRELRACQRLSTGPNFIVSLIRIGPPSIIAQNFYQTFKLILIVSLFSPMILLLF